MGVESARVNKVNEGRPHIVDMIKNDEIALTNTTDGPQAIVDSADIRRSALQHVYYTTTLAGAEAVVEALRSEGLKEVRRLQESCTLRFNSVEVRYSDIANDINDIKNNIQMPGTTSGSFISEPKLRQYPMTVEGGKALREELQQLKTVERPGNSGHCRCA